MHGVIMGTAAYMSPEQARGQAGGPRRRTFGRLAAVLYELLTGKQAFQGEDVADILAAVVKTEPDWKQAAGGHAAGDSNAAAALPAQGSARSACRMRATVRIEIEDALSGCALRRRRRPVAPAACRARAASGWLGRGGGDCDCRLRRRVGARSRISGLRRKRRRRSAFSFPRRTRGAWCSGRSHGAIAGSLGGFARRSSDRLRSHGRGRQNSPLGPLAGHAHRAVARRDRRRHVAFLVARQPLPGISSRAGSSRRLTSRAARPLRCATRRAVAAARGAAMG